jgi:hypothetical protein
VIPIWLRLVVAGIGVVLFFGSWFIGNTVDASHTPDSSRRESALLKDGLTLGARVVGVFLLSIGLLMWVANENAEHHHGIF